MSEWSHAGRMPCRDDRYRQPEFWPWWGMRQRVHNDKNKNFKHYGGRGIEICEEWDRDDDGFDNFVRDMGPRPSKQHSINRIDNDGDYEPENCRWALPEEQTENRRKQSCRRKHSQGKPHRSRQSA